MSEHPPRTDNPTPPAVRSERSDTSTDGTRRQIDVRRFLLLGKTAWAAIASVIAVAGGAFVLWHEINKPDPPKPEQQAAVAVTLSSMTRARFNCNITQASGDCPGADSDPDVGIVPTEISYDLSGWAGLVDLTWLVAGPSGQLYRESGAIRYELDRDTRDQGEVQGPLFIDGPLNWSPPPGDRDTVYLELRLERPNGMHIARTCARIGVQRDSRTSRWTLKPSQRKSSTAVCKTIWE